MTKNKKNTCNATKQLHLILFADDTNIFFQHKQLNSLIIIN